MNRLTVGSSGGFFLVWNFHLAFLGVFESLRKVTASCVMSACPSVRPPAWNNTAPSGRIFVKFGFFSIF